MNKIDVAILTEAQYINPKETDTYIEQVLLEDSLLKNALENIGFKTVKVDWADPDFNWSDVKICVFRSIWDYFHRYEEFCTWMDKVKLQTKFVNSLEQIVWNVDKHYLQDLEKAGVPIVESHFIEKGTKTSLSSLHANLGWDKTVIKPCVSGGGRHTYLLNPENYLEHESIFQDLISAEALILQPFQNNITTKGEVSHVVIAGKHTHSILKKAKEGDYRVQDDFGGTVHNYSASQEEIDFAESITQKCNSLPAYARIDVIWDNENKLAVGEVELIEPELWFRNNEQAAHLLAKEIEERIKLL